MIRLVISFLFVGSIQAKASSQPEDSSVKVPEQASAASAPFVDLPAGCWGRQLPCALTFTRPGTIRVQETLLSVSSNTAILFREKEMELLAGQLWSETFAETRIRHGIVQAVLTGDVLVEKEGDELTIINLNGVAEVTGGRKTMEPIPSGFQNWYRGLGQRGEFVQGVLEPMRSQEFLPTWVKLTGFRGSLALEKVSNYATNRKKAVYESAQLYQDILQTRRLAAEEQERKNAVVSAQRERERSHFRQMMRNRLFQPD